VGCVIGGLWAALAPRPEVVWVSGIWYAPAHENYGAGQGLLFALLSIAPGLAVGTLLVVWSARPAPIRRLACALGGALVGVGAAWAVGVGLTGGFGPVPPDGYLAAAPVLLAAWGLALVWPVLVALVPAAALSARGMFAAD
jgi:hypothetical protein